MNETPAGTRLAELLGRLIDARRQLFATLGRLDAPSFHHPPARGEWTPRQVCEHLVDNQNYLVAQLAKALRVETWPAQPAVFTTAEEAIGGLFDADEMLRWVIADLTDADFDRKYSLTGAGAFTVAGLLEQLITHDLDHTQQIREAIDG